MKPPSSARATDVRDTEPDARAVGTADAEEQGDAVYVPFRAWLEARPGRYVVVGAVALILLQALVRGYVKFGGWFVADDMSFIGRAEHMPFLSREYLLAGWNGHLMPGSFTLVRVLNHLWPVNYTPVALVDLAMQAVAGLLAFRLLVSLFGRRPAVLVPLSIYLFSPITLPAFLWWAAGLNQLPGQIAMIGALALQVRYHRTGRTRDGVLGALCVLGGLLFSEKLLLVVPIVFALTFFFFTPGRPVARVRQAVTQHWRVWVAYLAVVGPYTLYYVTTVPSPVGKAPDTTLAIQTVATALSQAVLPGLFGGPLRWSQIGVGGVANPTVAMSLFACVATALIVWTSVVRRRRAVFGWVVVAAYWLSNAVLLGITRASYVGPIIGAEYRYSTDVCIVFAVFGAAAFLPIVGTYAKGTPQRLLPRSPARPASAGSRPHRAEPAGLSVEGTVAGALCCAVVITSLVSTFQYDRFWRSNGSAPYFANARADIAASKRHITLTEINLPERVQAGFLGAFVKTSTMMSGFEPRPRFLTPGASAAELYMPDDSGHLRTVVVDGFSNRKGPEKNCGWRVGPDTVRIPLVKATLPWEWTARIGYLATSDATATVTVGQTTSKVTITKGAGSLYVLGQGQVRAVTIHGLSAGSMCTNDVAVGFPRPLPGSHP